MATVTKNAASLRTRQKIRTAFAELIQEKKSISNLHVTDIVKRADITRGTFYRHYNNLHEVAEDFQREILEAFFGKESNTRPRPGHTPSILEIDSYFDRLTLFLQDHAPIYHMLLSSDDALFFIEQLSQRLNQKLYRLLKIHNHNAAWLDVNFFVGGVTTLLIKFFHDDLNLSLDQLNHYVKYKFHQTFLDRK